MANSKLLLFIFSIFSFLAVGYSIQCYYGYIQYTGNQIARSIQTVTCPNDVYCLKTYTKQGSNYEYDGYGCPNTQCSSSKCYGDRYSGYCCCRGDYCNSTPSVSKYLIFPIITIYLLIF